MNWQNEAINDLQSYNLRKASIITMEHRIKELESKVQRLGQALNEVSVQGGKAKPDDGFINYLVECDRLKANINAVKGWLASVERGLNTLTEEERTVLNGFYINRISRHVDRLCDELHCEKSTIYRIKDTAVYKFTIAMYGFIDL